MTNMTRRNFLKSAGVMALAVAVYAAGLPALLRGAEAVNKSWPAFWDTLRGLGAKIDTE